MKIPIYNPTKKPIIGPLKRRTNQNKGMPSKQTTAGMWNQKKIFRNRIAPQYGLTTDDNIELFFGLTSDQVLHLSHRQREGKWLEIKSINKWLRRSGEMAIVFKLMRKGDTLLSPPGETYPPRRILNRDAYVYFRCVKHTDADGFLKTMEQISEGVDKTSDNTEDIVNREEAEEGQREEEKEVIEKLQPVPIEAKSQRRAR